MPFTVACPGTKIFRVHISGVRGDALLLDQQECGGLFFELNFDSFRSYTSPAATEKSEKHPRGGDVRNPRWEGYEMRFNYETVSAWALAAKNMTVAVYCANSTLGEARHFVGEAAVDLLTLVAGPEVLALSLLEGDMEKGTLHMVCDVEEVAETRVDVAVMTVTGFRSKALDQCTVRLVTKDSASHGVTSRPPDAVQHGQATFTALPALHMGTSVEQFFAGAGLTVELLEPGFFGSSVIGRGMVLFADFLRVGDADGAGLADSTGGGCPASPGAEQARQREWEAGRCEIGFRDVPLLDPEADQKAGEIAGRIRFDGLPLFVQMARGRTVGTGVVEGGAVVADFGQPRPPRVAQEA